MIRNYIKIAWRSLIKHKLYSTVNIFGLSTGILFTLLIAAYVWSEVQVNRNLNNPGQLYLLESKWKQDGMESEFKTVSPLAKLLKDQNPDLVSNYYRWDWVSTIVSNGDKHFRDSLQIGDTTLVTMFGFPVLYGNKYKLFSQPDAVVITASRALKYFGKTDVVGKMLTIENYSGQHKNFMVTGVLKDLPYNSVTTSNVPVNASINSTFISLNNLAFFYSGADITSWDNRNLTSYIELQKGITAKMIEQPIKQLFKLNASDYINENLSIHLAGLYTYNLDANNGIVRKMTWTLSGIALFILLMAVVNFVNITIGSSASRLKEIGVRKVLGGLKKQLVFQFLTESFILVTIAVCISLCLYHLVRPYFEQVVGKELPLLSSLPIYLLGVPVILIAGIGLLAGMYPAWILSSLKSAESLKGKLSSVDKNIFIRRLLVGFQFTTAIVVFAGAIIVTQQVNYFMNTDLGFNKEQIINLALPRNWTEEGVRKMEIVRNELNKLPGVLDVSLCYSIPNRNSSNNTNFYRPGHDSTKAIPLFSFITDEKYASTFQIPIVAGRFFTDQERSFDFANIVINETATKALGWLSSADAIGNKVKMLNDSSLYTVCGVVKDYHFESKRENIKPLVFFNVESWNAYRFLSLRLKPGNPKAVINDIQTKCANLLPAVPFEYTFMDETLHKAYLAEIHLENATYTATAIAILIVLLGVIGIVSLSITKRAKEIGIRKVLGASVPHIVTLFIREFIAIILLANLIAWPIGYMIMNGWLHDYAYRIKISPDVFIWVAFILTVITCVLISLQTIKAAIANPVKSLRTE